MHSNNKTSLLGVLLFVMQTIDKGKGSTGKGKYIKKAYK